MNLLQPLVFHYYTYRRFYLLIWFPVILLNGLFLYLKPDYYFHSTIFLTFFTILSSYYLGCYEYQKLMQDYLFLRPSKAAFFYSSLIFSGINALIQTSGLTIIYLSFSIHTENIFFFPFVFFASIFAFVLAAVLVLAFNFSNIIRILIWLILFGSFAYLSKGKWKLVFTYLDEFLKNKDLFLKIIPLLASGAGILFILTYLNLKTIKK